MRIRYDSFQDLSLRSRRRLESVGIHCHDDLVSAAPSLYKDDLLAIAGFGRKSLNEIIDYLEGEGLKLAKPGQDTAPLPGKLTDRKVAQIQRQVRAAKMRNSGMKLREIGAVLGVGVERARCLVSQGQRHLRRFPLS